MAKKARKSAVAAAVAVGSPRKTKASDVNPFEHLSLLNVRLLDLNAKFEVTDGNVPDKPTIEATATIGPSEGKGIMLVDGYVTIESHPKEAKESNSVLIVMVHFQCVYQVEEVGVEDLEKHAQVLVQGGMVIMWPHFREIIQTITSRMGIPPIILPMYLRGAVGDGKGQRITLTKPRD